MRIDIRELNTGDGFQFVDGQSVGSSAVYKIRDVMTYQNTQTGSVLTLPTRGMIVEHTEEMNDIAITNNPITYKGMN